MSFADEINALLAADPVSLEGEACKLISNADANQLYELLQGLNPSLPGAAKIAAVACARLRELASAAEGQHKADLQTWAAIAEADQLAISALHDAVEAEEVAKTAQEAANAARVDDVLGVGKEESKAKAAEENASQAENNAAELRAKADQLIAATNALRQCAKLTNLAVPRPALGKGLRM